MCLCLIPPVSCGYVQLSFSPSSDTKLSCPIIFSEMRTWSVTSDPPRLSGWVWAQRNDGNVQGQAVEDVQLPAFNFLPDHSIPQGRPISCGHGRSGAADWSDPQFTAEETEVKWSGSVGGGGRLMYGERETFLLDNEWNVTTEEERDDLFYILCGLYIQYCIYSVNINTYIHVVEYTVNHCSQLYD